jgi:SPP1 family predicted phage head-tail adaptor
MSLDNPSIRDPGFLDRRITLQAYTSSENEFGEVIETWTDLATVWANVRELRGTERFEAARLTAVVDAFFTIRWRTDVVPKMRVSYEGELFDIQAVMELPRREGLQLEAKWREPDQ